MEPKVARLVDFEEARRLADAVSIFQDLTSTAKALDRLVELMRAEKEKKVEVLEIPSLWTAALVGYARCFAHGMRYRLTEDVFAAWDPSARDFHRYLIDMRDKHIAHAVNPFEEVAIGVLLANEETGKPEVVGISSLYRRLVVTDEQGVIEFRRLVQGLLTAVAADCKRFEAEALAVAQKLDPASLTALPPSRLVTPEPADASRPRNRPSQA